MTSGPAPSANLAGRLERDADTPALILAGAAATGGPADRTVTHGELARRAARWRGGLAGAGVRPGQRVAIVAGNTETFVLAHLAVLGTGAVSVPLNPQSPPAELARELAAVDASAVVGDEAGIGPLEQALAAMADGVGPLGPVRLDPDAIDQGSPAPIVDVAGSDPAVLLFTSGTAGPPRPAVLTHANLTAALQAVLSLPTGLVERPQTFLAVVPLFHVLGLNTVLHLALAIGAAVVLDEFRDGPATIDLIERHRVTVALGPPNLWQLLSLTPEADADRLASVGLAVSGAARLPAPVELAVADRLGLRLDEGYGLTETAAVVASTVTTDAPLGSVGRLLPGVEARIVDDGGGDCLVGDPGELLVRGPMVFPGYWTAEGLDREPLDDEGWLRTGDLAVVDEDGHLAIVGRRKELIIVSGFNVFPAEVESILVDHPDVADAGVVGEPSEATGETVVAFVVPEAGRSVDEDELRDHCRAELARYKVPSRFVIATELPVGPTGKLRRNRLR